GRLRPRLAALEIVLADHLPALAPRRDRGLPAGVHPGDRRIPHSRPAWRLRYADDRQDAVGRVLPQPRLADGVDRRDPSVDRARRAGRVLPEHAGKKRGRGGMNLSSAFNLISLVLGFSLLYLPILILIVYSFNESRLVT